VASIADPPAVCANDKNKNARAFVASSVSALSSSSSSSAIDPSRSIVIESLRSFARLARVFARVRLSFD